MITTMYTLQPSLAIRRKFNHTIGGFDDLPFADFLIHSNFYIYNSYDRKIKPILPSMKFQKGPIQDGRQNVFID
jgi:hypothetical protein